MTLEIREIVRHAVGRQLTAEELSQIETSGGPEVKARADSARAVYAKEDALADGALKVYFSRRKEFGKEHNYAYQKCRRDTVLFLRSLVLAGVSADHEMLITEVRTWFITILQTVSVHLEETYLLWTYLRETLGNHLDAGSAAFLTVPLDAARRTVQEAMEERTAQGAFRN